MKKGVVLYMKEWILYLEEFNYISIFLRLLLAVVFGSIIGAERKNRNQAAGIRTFSLVCLGSAMAVLVNEYMMLSQDGSLDPSRMAAQVISGIGFLGVGTIIVTGNNRVRGLTTAASLWTTAILGIAIGAGFLYVAVLGFLFIMVTVEVLQFLSRRQDHYNRILELYLEMSVEDGMKRLQTYVQEQDYHIRSIQRKHQKAMLRDDICVAMVIDLGGRVEHATVISELDKIKGIDYIEEVH